MAGTTEYTDAFGNTYYFAFDELGRVASLDCDVVKVDLTYDTQSRLVSHRATDTTNDTVFGKTVA